MQKKAILIWEIIDQLQDNSEIIELASELASLKLEKEWRKSIKIYVDEEADELHYTDEAQDIFNEYYDDYISLIEKCIE
jgi:hypothetical protein